MLVSGVGVPDGLVSQAAAAAPQTAAAEPSVPGRPVPKPVISTGAEDLLKPATRAQPVWPKPGTVTVTLPTSGFTPVAVGTLPVRLARATTETPSAVRVDTFDNTTARRLGGIGLAVRVTRADGQAGVGHATATIDYSSFRDASGGGFASRLRLVALPACVLDAGPTAACRRQAARQAHPVMAANDVPAGTLTATLDAAATPPTASAPASAAGDDAPADGGSVYLVTSAATASDPGGGTGSFAATDLKPSGTWQAGQSGGEFTYSYPLTVPPPVGGQPPSLALSYSSSSVDSLTQYTNNQASWTGMGWDVSTGFIERRYRPCAGDIKIFGGNQNQGGWRHLCWESPDENDGESATSDRTNSQLVLSVAGKSSPIVWDTTTSKWKTVEDFGWKIEYLTSTAPSGQPYWQITTQDGTQYRLGFNRDASLQVPYLGDDTGEPCHDHFPADEPVASSFCVAPYRWNLDQEIDPRHNVTSYTYLRETNRYCSDPDFGCFFTGAFWLNYDRAATLAQINYGSNTTVAGSTPTARVNFTTVERGQAPQVGLPWDDDTPNDLIDGDDPAFFTSKRLDSITTATANSLGGWDDVTRWELGYRWITPPGADQFEFPDPVLWLDSIRQVGLAGTGADIALPKVGFDSVILDNRGDYNDSGQARLALPRISAIANGLGGRIEISYGQTNACPITFPSPTINGATNTKDCFQVRLGGPTSSVVGTYMKYLVTKVVEKDLVAGSPDMTTRYQYLGTPAWARPIDYNQPATSEGWDQWRGYQTVRTLKGVGTDPAGYSVTTSSFFRGMFDDLKADGTAKGIKVTDFDGHDVDDKRFLAGRTLQEQTWTAATMATPVFLCAYPAWVATTLYAAGDRVTRNNHHWRATTSTRGHTPGTDSDWADLGACPTSEPIPATFTEQSATRYEYTPVVTGNGPGIYDPRQINQTRQVAREKVTSGWRYTDQATTYNNDGLPATVNDYGDTATSTDNTCTSTTYAKNTTGTAWMIDYQAAEERRAGDNCTTGTFLGRNVTLYDGATSEAANAPTIGNVTETRTYTSTTVFVTNKATFDGYGRTLTTTNPLNKTVTITYSPAVGWPSNGRTTTNPLGHATTTWGSAATGKTIGFRDANLHDVNIDYDALGRTTTLWTPERPRNAGIAAATATYTIPADSNGWVNGPAVTGLSSLQSVSGGTPTYVTTFTYLDGLGRRRESQEASPAGGRVVEATTYDARGLTAAIGEPAYNTGQPGSGLVNAAMTSLPQWSTAVYDGLGRAAAALDMAGTTELRRTSTTYFGERTEITPPVGGKTVTYTDADDQVTKVEEWKDGTTHHDTIYGYDVDGHLTTMTDASGNVRTFGYDLLGRKITSHDPDAGDSAQAYDATGNIIWTTDGNGTKISYSYDDLGRKTATWAGEVGTGTKLAEWTYDTLASGLLTSATSYSDGNAYTDTVTGYDSMGRATGSVLTVPSAEGLLAGSYTFATSYTPAGHVATFTMPAAGGLPAETVTSAYTDLGLPSGLSSDFGGGTTYISAATYSPTARLLERGYGPASKIKRGFTWDSGTGRLTRLTTTTGADTATPQTVQDDQYFYDASGEITRVLDAATAVSGSTPGQSECFGYDGLHRLTSAYTTTASSCPTGSDGMGVDPYNQTYSYDGVGNITTLTSQAQTATYTYPTPGASAVRPNAVTSITRPSGTDSYGYDQAGQLTSRTDNGTNGSFTWTPLGQLSKATINGADTTMVYDADGERLIRRDPNGSTTLYLGSMEISATGQQITSKRYYSTPDGAQVAMRTSTGLTWLMSGLHGSTQLAVSDATTTVSRERYLPYGQRRGTDDLPFTDLGFLGKVEDGSTGLDYLTARYYDPAIARFVSTDPLLDLSRPQWANPYSYAGDNPIGQSDPTGLKPIITCQDEARYGHLSAGCQKWAQEQARKTAREAEKERQRMLQALERAAAACSLGNGFSLAAQSNCAQARAEVTAMLGFDPYAMGETEKQVSDMITSVMKFMTEDIVNCYNGGATACAAFAANFIPGEKLAAGFGKLAAKAAGRLGPRAEKVAQKFAQRVDGAVAACSSFVPGTRVLMADGSHQAIEKVKVGDKVLAADPVTGKLKPEPILALIATKGDKDLVQLNVTTHDKGHAVIVATAQHPFWAGRPGHWLTAAELAPGMWLRTSAGTHAQIAAIGRMSVHDQTVHNLTVADLHTYYVLAGDQAILVHNTGTSDPEFRIAGKYTGRIDRFTYKGQAYFEVHVYYRGKEVGIFGSNGWIGKHGHSANMRLSAVVENRLKGVAIDEMRKAGRLGPNDVIKGDAWKRPHVGDVC
ncbi:hypothetical protein J5X84_38465 [Streptosporangiaceae bacterium NEAU-GS5]|nr:hypothetical protein [Streptosporangiaceae bacterium NEAU-GS5]